MAWVIGGEHFGQYTYEHWFDNILRIKEGSIMQKNVIDVLVIYNKFVNEAMNGIIKTLSQEEWEKPFGGFFPSVRSLCSHIYICDFNWLKRFKNIRAFKVLDDPFFDSIYYFEDTIFPDIGEYMKKRSDLDNRIISFANELTGEDLGSVLIYTDSDGDYHERNAGGCVLHFLNHETHHRGMISVYLEMLGRENDFCSLTQVL